MASVRRVPGLASLAEVQKKYIMDFAAGQTKFVVQPSALPMSEALLKHKAWAEGQPYRGYAQFRMA
jgi:hypothetical protein